MHESTPDTIKGKSGTKRGRQADALKNAATPKIFPGTHVHATWSAAACREAGHECL
jgi:hypothetical protein